MRTEGKSIDAPVPMQLVWTRTLADKRLVKGIETGSGGIVGTLCMPTVPRPNVPWMPSAEAEDSTQPKTPLGRFWGNALAPNVQAIVRRLWSETRCAIFQGLCTTLA